MRLRLYRVSTGSMSSLALSSAQLVCGLAHAHQPSQFRVRETSGHRIRSRVEVYDIIFVALLVAAAPERFGINFHIGVPKSNCRLRGITFHRGSMALRV